MCSCSDGLDCATARAELCLGDGDRAQESARTTLLLDDDECGQTTVEAAFLIPVTFLMLMVLAQPAILLYDRMVMNAAAGQAVRMLATRPADSSDSAYLVFIESQLAPIPQVAAFHVGDGWDIELTGDETSQETSVTITAQAKPLPLVSLAASPLGLLDDEGCFVVEVSATMPTQPDWVWDQGGGPSEWVSQW